LRKTRRGEAGIPFGQNQPKQKTTTPTKKNPPKKTGIVITENETSPLGGHDAVGYNRASTAIKKGGKQKAKDES